MDLNEFNVDARQAVQWIQSILSPENLEFMQGLPEKKVHGDVTLSHGSPRNPVWEYILDWHVALDNFDFFETQYCFVGHTHLPVIFQVTEEESGTHLQILNPVSPIQLAGRAIANPGSVGQPRDRDARASYSIFDTKEHHWLPFRVTYDVKAVQERIRAVGLPERNAVRLQDGW
jgi:diadenosine tetraphosphatase ApaH/serine/threonine PP2A family protein phosphatase